MWLDQVDWDCHIVQQITTTAATLTPTETQTSNYWNLRVLYFDSGKKEETFWNNPTKFRFNYCDLIELKPLHFTILEDESRLNEQSGQKAMELSIQLSWIVPRHWVLRCNFEHNIMSFRTFVENQNSQVENSFQSVLLD